jgi:hypothetical protein
MYSPALGCSETERRIIQPTHEHNAVVFRLEYQPSFFELYFIDKIIPDGCIFAQPPELVCCPISCLPLSPPSPSLSQTRGGCVCAGPYAQRLLGIDAPLARLFEEELLRKDELVRPGFSRLRYVSAPGSERRGNYIDTAIVAKYCNRLRSYKVNDFVRVLDDTCFCACSEKLVGNNVFSTSDHFLRPLAEFHPDVH